MSHSTSRDDQRRSQGRNSNVFLPPISQLLNDVDVDNHPLPPNYYRRPSSSGSSSQPPSSSEYMPANSRILFSNPPPRHMSSKNTTRHHTGAISSASGHHDEAFRNAAPDSQAASINATNQAPYHYYSSHVHSNSRDAASASQQFPTAPAPGDGSRSTPHPNSNPNIHLSPSSASSVSGSQWQPPERNNGAHARHGPSGSGAVYPPSHRSHDTYSYSHTTAGYQGSSSPSSSTAYYYPSPEGPHNNVDYGFGGGGEASGSGTKMNYFCDFCGKGFLRPSALKTHVISHTGDQDFACPEEGCSRRFGVKSNMLRHVRLVHKHLKNMSVGEQLSQDEWETRDAW